MNQRNKIRALIFTKKFFHYLIAFIGMVNFALITMTYADLSRSWIFMFINMSLILSAIWPSKLLCACLIWLAVNAVFLLCLAMNIKRDLPIWVPGISHNPYLNWLITDPVLLSVAFWMTVLFSLIATTCSDNILAAEETNMSTLPLYHFNERTNLLPPSYSDCETPPPCYSQAVNMAGDGKEPVSPTYQDS